MGGQLRGSLRWRGTYGWTSTNNSGALYGETPWIYFDGMDFYAENEQSQDKQQFRFILTIGKIVGHLADYMTAG